MADVNQNSIETPGFDPRLFLRDEELDYGIALFLAGERTLMKQAGDLAEQESLPAIAARILIDVRFRPGQSVSGLREHLQVTVPTMARLLGTLDKRGLIERRKSRIDARQRTLYLTFEGKRLTDPATIAMRETLRNAYRHAGANAVAGVRAVLEALS